MSSTARFITVAIALLVPSAPAWATLGEPEASVARDREALSMKGRPATARGGVAVHEMRGPTVTVREFVAPSGTVFAVAWSGLTRPPLAALLGAYHDEYQAAAAGGPTPRGRRPRRVESARIVVETWGHARSLHGRAWVPALVPPGASLDDVR